MTEQRVRTESSRESVLAELGVRALDGESPSALRSWTVEAVAAAMEVAGCTLFDRGADGRLVRRAGVGPWNESRSNDRVDPDEHERSTIYEQALETGRSIVEDVTTERHLEVPTALREGGVSSVATVSADSGTDTAVVLSVQTVGPYAFTKDDVDFLERVADLLVRATDRRVAGAEVTQSSGRRSATETSNRQDGDGPHAPDEPETDAAGGVLQESVADRRQLETLFEVLPVGVVVAGTDGRLLDANDTAIELWGGEMFDARSVAEYDNYQGWWAHSGEPIQADEWVMSRVLRGEEIDDPQILKIEGFDDTRRTVMVHGMPVRDDDGEVIRGVVTLTDITERTDAAQKLRRRARQQASVAAIGQLALETDDLDELMAEAAHLTADALETEYSELLEFDADDHRLRLRHGIGWSDGVVGEATVDAAGGSQAGYTLCSEEPVVVENLGTERRFDPSELLTAHDAVAGITTCVGAVEDPWGILGAHTTEERTFTEEDVDFLQSVANVLATSIDRTRRKRELERSRAQLETLNHLNDVVSRITDAAIDQSTRADVERTVCEALADVDAYAFAWFAEADAQTGTLRPRTIAGIDDRPESFSISFDADAPEGRGPSVRALRTREVQVSNDVFADPAYEPWRDVAREYGFRSVASIPVHHEGTVYGVLGVYAERIDAFEGRELSVVSRLGEIVGHAIAAVDRKRALMSDDVTEVAYRVTDFSRSLGRSVETDGRISLNRAIPVDDEYVVFGRTAADARPLLEALVDELSEWQSVEFSDDSASDSGRETRFELRLSEAPLLGTVAAAGGLIENAVIEDGVYVLTVQLPMGADVREVTEGFRKRFPETEPISRRQHSRDAASMGVGDPVADSLTNRQRAALEAAYYAGYFEWPRDSNGQDVADALGVSPATFTQHLRAAELTLFERLIEGPPPSS